MREYLPVFSAALVSLIWTRYSIGQYKMNKDIKRLVILGIPLCITIGLIPVVRNNNNLRNIVVTLATIDVIIYFIIYESQKIKGKIKEKQQKQ